MTTKILLMLASAAMLGTTPTLADPGKGSQKAHAAKHVGHKASAKSAAKSQKATRALRDRNRNSIDDRSERERGKPSRF